MTLFVTALKRSFHSVANVIIIMVLPLAFVLFPIYEPTDIPQGLYWYGLIVLFSAFLLAKQLIDNRTNRTIIRIAASPISHFRYLAIHLLSFTVILWIQNTVFFIVMKLYWGDAIESAFWTLSLYYVLSVTMIALCLFWNSLFRTYYTSLAFFAGVASLLTMITGVTVPLDVLPDSILEVARFLPTYWFAYGLEMVYNGHVNDVLTSLLIMLIFAVLFLVVGSRRRL
ncbi:MAG: ABC transporter permease [Acholeplasmataceae bacterium]